jgi:hypothetical protein
MTIRARVFTAAVAIERIFRHQARQASGTAGLN